MKHSESTPQSAIVLAAFGTTYPSTLEPILAMLGDIEQRYPGVPVRLAFTSNFIRRKWHERAADAGYRRQHPSIPQQIFAVKNVLGAMADLQNEDCRRIVVQPVLIVDGEEYRDLTAYVQALAAIKTHKPRLQPFERVAIGQPLLGSFHHRQQLDALVQALKPDVEAARASGAALVYMGHGNEHMAQGAYYELEILLRREYGIPVCIGLVEGLPDFEIVQEKLLAAGTRKVLLKPLMFVAGDHARNDMAGDEEDSWLNMLQADGYAVTTVLEGLGQNPAVRSIFLDSLEQAAQQAGIALEGTHG
ncbi:sirohydrochlorin cobaltochelatase [Desulfurispira natronophila]|uniref:Sirohydrochlorin cobaltochelatase n=1 Tax=Desulfurispira natronophila TaxID=682562 RepID=A0A7W7Y5N3_9BACT|nr:sirohydrochlorin cobaltochelatase [Desulfurispira natronophila]MBB5022523.1 sirohydrochlorin cobaltochelatase [Desulfurispira natronophila]